MVLLGDEPKWKLISVRLGIVLILIQDSCTDYAEHTIGSEIILNTPDGISRSHGPWIISFGPFGDGVSVSAR